MLVTGFWRNQGARAADAADPCGPPAPTHPAAAVAPRGARA